MLGVGTAWVQRKAFLDVLSRMRLAWDAAEAKLLPPELSPDAGWVPMGGGAAEVGELVSAMFRMEKLLSKGVVARQEIAPSWQDAIWLLECVAEAVPDQWWVEQVAAWRGQAHPSLRGWLQCEEEVFLTKLEQACLPREVVSTGEAEGGIGVDAELLEAFLSEVDERLQACEEILLGFEQTPEDRDAVQRLFRHYHSLKGAAAAAGLEDAVAQLHQGESLLQSVRDGEIEVQTGPLVDFLLRLGDSVRALVERGCGRAPRTEPIADLDEALARLIAGSDSAEETGESVSAEQRDWTPHGFEPGLAASDDSLSLSERLRQRITTATTDPELLLLIETLERRAAEAAARAAALEQEVQTLRTIPLEDVFRRLPRALRDSCRQEGKRAKLELGGGELRIERELAEPLVSALTHLVRNAVAHGIEDPAHRVRIGKSPEGSVHVSASVTNGQLVVVVEDNGRGLDLEAVRRRALALGLLKPSVRPTAEELLQLIFRPGFSTRETASEIAGRGVGLDAVAQEIQALGGTVSVSSRAGQGMRVTIALPRTLAGPRGPQ